MILPEPFLSLSLSPPLSLSLSLSLSLPLSLSPSLKVSLWTAPLVHQLCLVIYTVECARP